MLAGSMTLISFPTITLKPCVPRLALALLRLKNETQKIIEILEPKIKAVQQSMKKASVERQIAEIMARRCQHLSDIFAFEIEFSWDDTVHSKAFVNPKTIQ